MEIIALAVLLLFAVMTYLRMRWRKQANIKDRSEEERRLQKLEQLILKYGKETEGLNEAETKSNNNDE